VRHLPDQPWYTSKYNTSATFDEDDTARVGGIIKALLGSGADALAVDSLKYTPLDLAIEYNCPEMIRALSFSSEEVQKKWEVLPQNLRLQTILALKQPAGLGSLRLPKSIRMELFENPSRYLPLLQHQDVVWMSRNGLDVT